MRAGTSTTKATTTASQKKKNSHLLPHSATPTPASTPPPHATPPPEIPTTSTTRSPPRTPAHTLPRAHSLPIHRRTRSAAPRTTDGPIPTLLLHLHGNAHLADVPADLDP